MVPVIVPQQPTVAPLSLREEMVHIPTLADPKIESLAAMFPEIEKEVLGLMLAHHQGDIEAAVSSILDVAVVPDYQAEEDRAVANAMQLSQDEEVARTVHQAIQRELKAEEEARRQDQPAARAERAVAQAAEKAVVAASGLSAGAKALLARLAKGPNGGTSSRSTSTHAVRLLEPSSDGGGYDVSPLAFHNDPNAPLPAMLGSEYAPPVIEEESRNRSEEISPAVVPMVAPEAMRTSPSSSISTSPTASMSGSPTSETPPSSLLSMGSSGAVGGSAASRYSSRMERARSHNLTRGRAQTAPLLAPEPAPVVPVGELI